MANIVHAKNVTVADWSGVVTVGNSTGGTATDQASNLARPTDWNSQHNFTLSASDIGSFFAANNGLSASTNTNGVTYGVNTVGFFEPSAIGATGFSSIENGSWKLRHFAAPFGIPPGMMRVFHTRATTADFKVGAIFTCSLTGSMTKNHSQYNRAAIYTQGTGASSTALYSLWTGSADIFATQNIRQTTSNTAAGTTSVTFSNYATLSIPSQYDSTGGMTYGTTTYSGSNSTAATATSLASTFIDSLLNARSNYIRASLGVGLGISQSLSQGEYWFATMNSSATASSGTNNGVGTVLAAHACFGNTLAIQLRDFGQLGLSSTNSSTQNQLFVGNLQTTTSAATSKIATVNLHVPTTPIQYYFNVAQYFSSP